MSSAVQSSYRCVCIVSVRAVRTACTLAGERPACGERAPRARRRRRREAARRMPRSRLSAGNQHVPSRVPSSRLLYSYTRRHSADYTKDAPRSRMHQQSLCGVRGATATALIRKK